MKKKTANKTVSANSKTAQNNRTISSATQNDDSHIPTTEDERLTQIGVHLKKLRVHRGYSSAEIFAYEHDLNRVSYWRMEKGSNITLKSLIRILDIHKVSLKEFFQDFE